MVLHQEASWTIAPGSEICAWYLLAAASVLSLACSNSRVEQRAVQFASIQSVAIEPDSLVLEVGMVFRLRASLVDPAGNRLLQRPVLPSLIVGPNKERKLELGDEDGRTGPMVRWISSDPGVAIVDHDGVVTAVGPGTATITSTSEGKDGYSIVAVRAWSESTVVVPLAVRVSVGEVVQFEVLNRHGTADTMDPLAVRWSTDRPLQVEVGNDGRASALRPGTVRVAVVSGKSRRTADLLVKPSRWISGLDFPGSAGVHATMRLEFRSPPPPYPATYVWRAYPRQQRSYYTAFFWGNNGAFYPSHTYYGFHPYPDFATANWDFWEIAAPPGGDFVSQDHVEYDRWYVQVAICTATDNGTSTVYYWDWPDTTRVVRHAGPRYEDPPAPGLVVGDSPWNPGQEVWNGVLRGFQFYDAALTLDEVAEELRSPGTARVPWYLNLDPTPMDIADKSGNDNTPAWVGAERPSVWTGLVGPGGGIRTRVPPP